MSSKKQASGGGPPMIQNRKARHNFELLERYEAGIALTGSEVKSIRQGRANLQEAYCFLQRGELFVRNLHISAYEQGGYANHDPWRTRKLLLKRKELNELKKSLQERGRTVVPLKMFFNKRNLAKVEIALARGKKTHDKRASLKEKELKREMSRE